VATTKTDAGPLTVSHTGQLPSVTISFNLKPGYALGDAVTAIKQTAAATVPASGVDDVPGHRPRRSRIRCRASA
jgi:HAE1 family hydrophobic/amphiphilic exporter-1